MRRMHRKALWIAAIPSIAGGFTAVHADMIPTPDGIAVKAPDVATPARGMTMDQVASKFGAPVTKIPAVGTPPISRWEYPGFVVYFERDHVIHSVAGSTPAEAPAAAPAAATAPAPGPAAPAPTTSEEAPAPTSAPASAPAPTRASKTAAR